MNSTTEKSSPLGRARPGGGRLPAGAADLLALGFGTTVAMWAIGYVCRLPPVRVPSPLVLAGMLVCLFAGGIVCGRYSARSWRGGVAVGLISSVLNLLILGSLLSGDDPNRLVPAALLWLPGWFLASALLVGAGALVGRQFGASGPQPDWTTWFAGVTCAATLLLLAAGGLVTSKEAGLAVVDWPNSFGYNMFLYPLSKMSGGIYYEHAHRLFGSLVGLATIVLTVHLWRVDGRRWLRWLAVIVLLAVVVQGVLGGLRVTGRFTLSTAEADMRPSTVLALVHGVFGQVVFGLLVAITVFVSPAWRRRRPASPAGPRATDAGLALVLIGLLLVQLALGALQRHMASALLIHISFAVIVIFVSVACGVRAWGLYADDTLLARIGQTLVGVALVQVFLGVAALIAIGMRPEEGGPTGAEVVVATAHQAVGAVLLAMAVVLALLVRREPAAS